jgi:hypothetical protein
MTMGITVIIILLVLLGAYLIFSAKSNTETKNKNNPLDNEDKTTRLDKP